MAGALRGGLSAAFTGDSFWSHDIAGFVGATPDEELYIRWAQFGLLSPFARFHGTTPREPWYYGTRALSVVREYTHLRYSLVPYLLAGGRESCDTGLPLLRPMVLEFPTEPRIDGIDDQYMLGPDLLVAPIFQPGVKSRSVYLPKGQWWSFDRPGAPILGPGYHEIDAPLERIPVLVRSGAIIPRYLQPPFHLKGATPRDWLLDIYPSEGRAASRRTLVIPEPGFTLTLAYTCENGSSRLEISPAPVTISVLLIDRRPVFLRAEGAALQPGAGGVTFVVDAGHGARVEFKV